MNKVKRIVVGDIHGRYDIFKKIYDKEQPENPNEVFYNVIILGDYFDTYEDISSDDQLRSFLDLRTLQEKHLKTTGDFVMLVGNHDFHYIVDDQQYSGYSNYTNCIVSQHLKNALKEHKLKFAEVDYHNRTIYSHAGITNTWINDRHNKNFDLSLINVDSYDKFKFVYGKRLDPYGDDPMNGPLWVRPNSLISDMYKSLDEDINTVTTWTQIVGHTSCKKPIIAHEDGSQWKEGEDWRFAKFWDIDCLKNGYYMVEWFDDDMTIISREIKKMEEN